MFANFTALFRRRDEDHDPFVEGVEPRHPLPRNRGVEKLLFWGWVAILAKSVFVVWAWKTYPVPFHPGWLVWPTVAFGILCTAVYWWRVKR